MEEYKDRPIKEGDVYKCIKTVHMDDGSINYYKDKFYTSHLDGCITGEKESNHYSGSRRLSEYFVLVRNEGIKMDNLLETQQFIDENKEVLKQLLIAGVLKVPDHHSLNNSVRDSNVGNSDYSSKSILQPWSIWYLWKSFLTPWDLDIIKRLYRTKKGESRIMDYEKIIHNCKERIRQLQLEELYERRDN